MVNLDTDYFNQYRVMEATINGGWLGDGQCGLFYIPSPIPGRTLVVRASSYEDNGWDHVSVFVRRQSRRSRRVAPALPETRWVKVTFFGKDEWVVQYYPPGDDASVVLHLWGPPAGLTVPSFFIK